MSTGERLAKESSSYLTILSLIFITLKLCHVITWSWWWVTSPLWLPMVICWPIVLIIWLVIKALEK